MYTLGINAAFHDSSACLVKDGRLLAAAEEERFTHIKHGKRPLPFTSYEMPHHAVDYCLKVAGISLGEVDHVAYAFDPSLLPGEFKKEPVQLPLRPGDSGEKDPWDPLFYCYQQNAAAQLTDGYPHHLQERFAGSKSSDFKWHFVDHHLSHAASAFLPSPFPEAGTVVLDGRGETVSTSYYTGSGTELTRIGEVHLPHSLGLLYEQVTTHLGFLHSSDEYKVMALASYGKAVYADAFRSIIHVSDDGTYRIEDTPLEKLIGPARTRGTEFGPAHFDIAHSLQLVLQETVIKLLTWFQKKSGQKNLCLAGGVALNCVLNGVIRDSGLFENVWIQPAAGDAGTALGAALWIDARERHSNESPFRMEHTYYGPEYSDDEVEAFLKWTKVEYTRMDDVAVETAALLARDQVIGWYQGRMEFGPRALGSRSILASPVHAGMQAKLNDIKDREDFRPVAPVVLEEEAHNWFHQAGQSPFMLFVSKVRPEMAGKIPAVTHVDGTARIQTVNESQNPLYYRLLQEFQILTNVPVLINTSFNTRGEPVVCSPRDAVESFWTSPLDALVINRFLLQKKKDKKDARVFSNRESEAFA